DAVVKRNQSTSLLVGIESDSQTPCVESVVAPSLVFGASVAAAAAPASPPVAAAVMAHSPAAIRSRAFNSPPWTEAFGRLTRLRTIRRRRRVGSRPSSRLHLARLASGKR